MRLDRDRLIFLALAALHEAAHAAGDGPVRPTVAIRFALAYLYDVAGGPRTHFDDFWREMQDPRLGRPGREGDYIRGTRTRSCLTGIMRSVGYPLWPEAYEALARTWRRQAGSPSAKI